MVMDPLVHNLIKQNVSGLVLLAGILLINLPFTSSSNRMYVVRHLFQWVETEGLPPYLNGPVFKFPWTPVTVSIAIKLIISI
jgi:hypothetical protein